jgi:hypothetical protein
LAPWTAPTTTASARVLAGLAPRRWKEVIDAG